MKQTTQTGPLAAIISRDRSTWRMVVLLAVILALLGVATASASPAHFHPKTATGCDLCLTASLTASAQLAQTEAVPVPQSRALAEILTVQSRYELLRYHASHTRGPPAPAL